MTTHSRAKRSGGRRWWIPVLGVVVLACTLGFLWMRFGSAHRRPIAVIGGPSGPWRVEVDGEPTSCDAVARVTDEASAAREAARCWVRVWSGDHVLAVRDANGRLVREERVAVPVSQESYLWAPELPEGQCLRMDRTYYGNLRHGPGPSRREVGRGLVEIQSVTHWFAASPDTVSVTGGAAMAARTALRLVECRRGVYGPTP